MKPDIGECKSPWNGLHAQQNICRVHIRDLFEGEPADILPKLEGERCLTPDVLKTQGTQTRKARQAVHRPAISCFLLHDGLLDKGIGHVRRRTELCLSPFHEVPFQLERGKTCSIACQRRNR